MSELRPTLKSCPGEPGLDYSDTYYRVFEATASVRSLIHGRLHANGQSCAIATYNDSFPKLTQHERWKKVRKWLKFKVAALGKNK